MEYDSDYNGEISYSEARNITEIHYSWSNNEEGISSLEGVQYCTNLRNINVDFLKIKTFNIHNSSLLAINCSSSCVWFADVSNCTSLTSLKMGGKLSSLNVSGCYNLEELRCSKNNLISLNTKGLTALTTLSCEQNEQLTSLDVSGCTALTELDCHMSNLISLNINGCDSLKKITCNLNNLTAEELNEIFNQLPQGQTWTGSDATGRPTTKQSTIDINFNPGTKTCDRSIATNKGWIVEGKYSPEENPWHYAYTDHWIY